MSKKEILETLASNREELAAMGVRSLSLFGSYARGQELPGSDIDLLVEFSAPIGLFAFVRLKGFLERILECQVDLVTSDAIKERYRDSILKDAVRAAQESVSRARGYPRGEWKVAISIKNTMPQHTQYHPVGC